MATDKTDYNTFLETKVDYILDLQKEHNSYELTIQLGYVDKILSVFRSNTQLPSTEKLIKILSVTHCLNDKLYRWNSVLVLTYGALCMEFSPSEAREKLYEFRNELAYLTKVKYI